MTSEEWLACTDPVSMLLAIRDIVSDRKMRLFAIACCRRIWDRITDPSCRAAVEFAEESVEEGLLGRRGRRSLRKAAGQACLRVSLAGDGPNPPDEASRMVATNAFRAGLATLEPTGWSAANLASGYSANAIGWEWGRDKHPGLPD